MIRSCSSREKMSKARSPRAVVSSTIGMRLLRGASWEGGWKLGEWKLRLSAEAAVARPRRIIGRALGARVGAYAEHTCAANTKIYLTI